LVIGGEEKLIKSVKVPIEGIRGYDSGVPVLDFTLGMRGNGTL
jgi:hypothetical protein